MYYFADYSLYFTNFEVSTFRMYLETGSPTLRQTDSQKVFMRTENIRFLSLSPISMAGWECDKSEEQNWRIQYPELYKRRFLSIMLLHERWLCRSTCVTANQIMLPQSSWRTTSCWRTGKICPPSAPRKLSADQGETSYGLVPLLLSS